MVNESFIETLIKVYSNNSLIVNELKLKVRVKVHPFLSAEYILKKIKWNNLPHGWEWAKKDLNSELEDSYCCIAMDTASVYDAILKGNIVIPLMGDFMLMDNYLDIFSTKYPFVNSVSEKDLASQLRSIFESKTKQYQDEF